MYFILYTFCGLVNNDIMQLMDYEFERKFDAKLVLSVLASALMTFTGIVVETSMNVTFPTLMREFHIETGLVQWCTTGYLLVLSLIIPSSPFLIRRFRMKHLFIFANLCFILGTVICMTAPEFSIMLLGRIIQGIGTGVSLPLMYNIILTQAPYEKTGFLVGIAAMIPGIGPAIGPFIGGFITLLWGWRMIFAFLLPLLAISLVLGAVCIRQSAKTERIVMDKQGYLFIALCFVCLVFAINQSGNLGWLHPLVLLLYAGTVLFLFLFIKRSNRFPTPLIRLTIFRYKRYTLSLLGVILFALIALGIGFVLPNYGQICIGLNTLQAGSLLLPGCAFAAILNPFAGKRYDKNGGAKLIKGTFLFSIIALILYAITLDHATFILLTMIYLVFGVGMGCINGLLVTNGLQGLPDELYADGNAVFNTLQQLFCAIGTVIASSIVAAAQAKMPQNMAAGTLTGSRTVFIVFIVLAIAIYIMIFGAVKHPASHSYLKSDSPGD